MTQRTALVSGAGIAGLTLAYWLRRHGWATTVVERSAAPRTGGYKIDIRGAALGVVDRMGLLPQIRTMTTDVRAGAIVDGRGRRVASMGGDTFGGRQGPDTEIRRGDLLRLLTDTAGVDCRYSDAIAALDQDDDGVAVRFASGRTGRYDVVVGADGLHSATRRLAFGPEDRYVRPMGYHVCVYRVPDTLGLDREEVTYVAPGRTALVYRTAHDAGATAMFLFEGAPAGRMTAEAQRRLLAETYATDGWRVPALLSAAADAPDFYFDTMAQVHADRWSTGRVALVGDAGYAASSASGQGTSLALVGGYVLARELAAATDHRTAFDRYERRMRPFVEVNQKLGPANVRRMVLRTERQVRMSMRMLGLIGRLPGHDRLFAAALAPIHRAATAITLDDAPAAPATVS
ncbi:FAD-dependent oxidoreductase [Actinocatenispora thailandica]|uniref:FAD-dependent oxidoreductase n=1 Tax=Actinocatenispora thailandica TaxID=227318 RepID=A0A7R7HUB7_9ACTN|nr:FAD-dependent monooxygenase [Actinocatenispora thailandica]BCJ32677.1 FAD-dependent oxidoreductase [Actinocatenispora thailandica]